MNGTPEGVTYRLALWPEGNGLAAYGVVGLAKAKAGQDATVPTESASQARQRSTVPTESAFSGTLSTFFHRLMKKCR
jgi:hypothetical protein